MFGFMTKPGSIADNQSTKGKLFGVSTIYGKDGEATTPYMTRFFIGRLRFHIFHRGDADPDHHDHPWGFWTFPLTSYVEEVLEPDMMYLLARKKDGFWLCEPELQIRVVRRFRLHYRPAYFAHRVLGRQARYAVNRKTGEVHTAHGFIKDGMVKDVFFTDTGPIYTIVWRDAGWDHLWGFWKQRFGKLCWVPFKTYVAHGGKDAPCS